MRILFLTPQVPYPPQKGTAIRNWGLISGLAKCHEISVLSFLDPGQSSELTNQLTAVCRVEVSRPPARPLRRRLLDMLLTRKPDMALRLASEPFARRLADWLARESFDIVHVEGIELACYLDVIEAAHTRPVIVFDDHNCEYLLQYRTYHTDVRTPARWLSAAYSIVQWRRLRRYEAQVCRRTDHVLAVSDSDATALRKLVQDLGVTVVPNGIDTQAYRPDVAAFPERQNGRQLVFTGTMDFRPNVDAVLWFARQVLPRIQRDVPDVQFIIVGQRPHRRLDILRANPAITLTGHVKEDKPYIAGAAVYVAPLRIGGGTRLKLLQAMAMGKPMVATRMGAEGYPVSDGRELLLADTPSDFAEAVVGLLHTPERRRALGKAARAFVVRQYDWRSIIPVVEAVYAGQFSLRASSLAGSSSSS